jgi:hypothetical protein|tara:strand:+ start:49 stop:183 length:135 start_codon:yes stop_codon:yes gene_type:complete
LGVPIGSIKEDKKALEKERSPAHPLSDSVSVKVYPTCNTAKNKN